MAELKGFKGISFPFRFNSKGGVETSTTSPSDFSHIEESLEQIIHTEVGERAMEEFGSKLRKRTFEPIDDLSDESVIIHDIKSAIEKYDDRVEVQDVDLVVDEETLIISVNVFIEKYYTTETFNYRVKRGEF